MTAPSKREPYNSKTPLWRTEEFYFIAFLQQEYGSLFEGIKPAARCAGFKQVKCRRSGGEAD